MPNPDIVYLCRPGENHELRYSLRSLRNLPHGRVFIYGDAPNWIDHNNVRLVATPRSGGKFTITQNSLRAACLSSEVRDGFLLFNDDFYITKPIPKVPILHRGPILDVVADYRTRGIESGYIKAMVEVDALLKRLGHKDPKSYELHVPFPVVKRTMIDALQLKNTERFQWRTVYGNLANKRGQRIDDVKVYDHTDPLPDGPFMSTNDKSIRYFINVLDQMFPDPSPYELQTR